jgi:hypothetical protein
MGLNCKFWPHHINVRLNFAVNNMSHQTINTPIVIMRNFIGTFALPTSLYHVNPHFGQVSSLYAPFETKCNHLDMHG